MDEQHNILMNQHVLLAKSLNNTLYLEEAIIDNQVLIGKLLNDLQWNLMLTFFTLIMICVMVYVMAINLEKINKKHEEEEELRKGAYTILPDKA